MVSEEELGDLFKRYASYVATIGIRLLGRDDELDDLVQEVFIEAYRGLHQLRSPDAVKAWLARITVRRATRRLRRRRLRAFFSLDSLPADATTAHRGCAPTTIRIITARSCSILTATISRRCATIRCRGYSFTAPVRLET